MTKDQRFIGKVKNSRSGIKARVGAFQTMARGYGLKVTPSRMKLKPRGGGASNIVKYWYSLEDARNIGRKITLVRGFGTWTGISVEFLVKGSFLFL